MRFRYRSEELTRDPHERPINTVWATQRWNGTSSSSVCFKGRQFPNFISGPFFMGTVKYSFGKEQRQDSQTVYCTFPCILGGLANVSCSCLTKEMPSSHSQPELSVCRQTEPEVQLHDWENAAILPTYNRCKIISIGFICWMNAVKIHCRFHSSKIKAQI